MLDDRHRIAEDLHDLVIQHLFASALTLQGIDTSSDPALAAPIARVAESLDAAMLTLRGSIRQLNSRQLNSLPQAADSALA